MDVLIFLIGWIIFSYALAGLMRNFKAIAEAIVRSVGFIFTVPLTLLGKGMKWSGVKLARGIYWASIFVGIFIKHAVAGEEDEEEEEQVDDEAYEEGDPLQNAFVLFGLNAECTQQELNTAYREIIVDAHPDATKTGSTTAAQRVNAARDLIKQHKGWS